MPIWGEPQVWFNGQSYTDNTTMFQYTSGSSVYPFYVHPQAAISPVLESPSAKLGDREWLEAQVAEVCELAVAA